MIQQKIDIKIVLMSSVLLLLITSPYIITESFPTSSNNRINWKEMCNLADAIISEPCNELVVSGNPYQLTKEGEKVLYCIGGGALAIVTGHLELLSLGPSVGCGGSRSSSSNYESNSNPLNDILSNFLGN